MFCFFLDSTNSQKDFEHAYYYLLLDIYNFLGDRDPFIFTRLVSRTYVIYQLRKHRSTKISIFQDDFFGYRSFLKDLNHNSGKDRSRKELSNEHKLDMFCVRQCRNFLFFKKKSNLAVPWELQGVKFLEKAENSN